MEIISSRLSSWLCIALHHGVSICLRPCPSITRLRRVRYFYVAPVAPIIQAAGGPFLFLALSRACFSMPLVFFCLTPSSVVSALWHHECIYCRVLPCLSLRPPSRPCPPTCPASHATPAMSPHRVMLMKASAQGSPLSLPLLA